MRLTSPDVHQMHFREPRRRSRSWVDVVTPERSAQSQCVCYRQLCKVLPSEGHHSPLRDKQGQLCPGARLGRLCLWVRVRFGGRDQARQLHGTSWHFSPDCRGQGRGAGGLGAASGEEVGEGWVGSLADIIVGEWLQRRVSVNTLCYFCCSPVKNFFWSGGHVKGLSGWGYSVHGAKSGAERGRWSWTCHCGRNRLNGKAVTHTIITTTTTTTAATTATTMTEIKHLLLLFIVPNRQVCWE